MPVKRKEPAAPVVEVAVALPVFGTFSYRVPEIWNDAAVAGARVLVPFKNRRATGYVLGPGEAPAGVDLLPVEDVLDPAPLLPATMIPWLRWMADYYLHPLGEVIRTALPGGLTDADISIWHLTETGAAALAGGQIEAPQREVLEALQRQPARTRSLRRRLKAPGLTRHLGALARLGWIERRQTLVRGATRPKNERFVRLAEGMPPSAVGPKAAARLLPILENGDAVSMADLRAKIPNAARLVSRLAARGQVTVEERPVFRDPFGEPVRPDAPLRLNADQQRAADAIVSRLGGGFATFLLAGVTGSGKTEIYLQAAAEAVRRGLNVLVLAPEIALIAQLEHRFRARFGAQVALLHSGLSAGERYDQWRRIVAGETRVAIGARSAVFAPFPATGLIIVDEEHDGAFKQETGLHYNARDMAILRGRYDRAVVLLGSATPSMAALHAAAAGRYQRLDLPERIESRPLPSVEIIDLRADRDKRGVRRFLSAPLLAAMQETLDRGQQVLLFLNRRGFAAFPVCAACGEALRCRRCAISLTLHQSRRAYQCHYCGDCQPADIRCPHCGADKIRPLGLGTEKLETLVQGVFPQARVARMDRDTVGRRKQLLTMLRQLREGAIDVLVGTQMVAKGHDFPGITLVGIVCADQTLNFPDFRAGERTFQLLAQVAGRAGRGASPGRVLLQTFNPDHFSIRAACAQDPDLFYRQEMALRQALAYPPATRLALVRLAGRDPERTTAAARRLGEVCRQQAAGMGGGVEVLGPAPAPIEKIAGRHRWQILIKDADVQRLRRLLGRVQAEALGARRPRDVQVVIDVDPQSML
ncbi:MAG TPA: primosomal protein N' [Desulfobacteraceae bacterium]|nr:primosomal protein N' [Deltaproteobacteria bacterium]HDI60302.1 primosomal protein N' [Desulfobacteraceae bacterium]